MKIEELTKEDLGQILVAMGGLPSDVETHTREEILRWIEPYIKKKRGKRPSLP
jgi:hypothetical protein